MFLHRSKPKKKSPNGRFLTKSHPLWHPFGTIDIFHDCTVIVFCQFWQLISSTSDPVSDILTSSSVCMVRILVYIDTVSFLVILATVLTFWNISDFWQFWQYGEPQFDLVVKQFDLVFGSFDTDLVFKSSVFAFLSNFGVWHGFLLLRHYFWLLCHSFGSCIKLMTVSTYF